MSQPIEPVNESLMRAEQYHERYDEVNVETCCCEDDQFLVPAFYSGQKCG